MKLVKWLCALNTPHPFFDVLDLREGDLRQISSLPKELNHFTTFRRGAKARSVR